jgi:MFS transporter, DHA2 family, methylenomycin A resistance protein
MDAFSITGPPQGGKSTGRALAARPSGTVHSGRGRPRAGAGGGDGTGPAKPRAAHPGWVPLVALGLGYFMVILDATAVNLALPALARDLGGGVSALQWVLDGYTITFAAFLLTAGSVSDRLGSLRVFLAGLTLFTLASAGCGLAPSIAALITLRVVQGTAAAMLVPSSLALLQAAYTSRAARARAVGLWGAMGGAAAASGPVIGGALTGAASWRLVFAVNVPVGLGALWLAARHLATPASGRDPAPDGRRGTPPPGRRGAGMDRVGQVTAVIALAALAGALIEGGPLGWGSPLVLAAAATAVLAAVGFVLAERRSRAPMLPLALLRRPTLSAGSAVGLLINLGLYGQLFAFSLYLQQVRGDSPLAAGIALLPEAGIVPFASALSGRLTSRTGPRVTMLAGLLLGGAGFGAQVVAGPATPYLALVLPLAAAGAGMALTMPAMTTAVMESAPDGWAGLASGLLTSSRQVGSTLGVALAGALVAGQAGFVPGLHAALAVSGGGFLAGALLTALFVDRSRSRVGQAW